jgi:serine O-acetyltransferase
MSSPTRPDILETLPTAELCRVAHRLAARFDPAAGDSPDALPAAAPEPPPVVEALRVLLDAIFPGKISASLDPTQNPNVFILHRLTEAWSLLAPQVLRALPYRWLGQAARVEGPVDPIPVDDLQAAASELLSAFFRELPGVRDLVASDVRAAYDGDPAALTYAEVLLAYPGLLAIAAHRVSHLLYRLRVPILPRIMSEWVHTQTGADIHPGATIGPSFFIDHATGVVIGETAEIGARVKIYQGVTLGARSFELDPDGNPVKHLKRHPTVRDNVILYANATILGGDVVIGENAVIGSNVYLTASVPPDTVVAAAPPALVQRPRRKGKKP